MREVCIVEGCPGAGRHFVDEHVEEDYAVKAAREWWDLAMAHSGCDICNNPTSCEIPPACGCADEFEEQCQTRLAAIIRKHVARHLQGKVIY